MSEAYSIMSPSFTRPKNVRKSSLSTNGARPFQADESAPPQSPSKSKISKTSEVDLTTDQTDNSKSRSDTEKPPEGASFQEQAKSMLSAKLDSKILIDLMTGKYGPVSDSDENLRRFLKHLKDRMPSASSLVLTPDPEFTSSSDGESDDDSDSEYDDESDDDVTVTEDGDVHQSQGRTATGTLVRKELRPRQNNTGSSAPKRGLRR